MIYPDIVSLGVPSKYFKRRVKRVGELFYSLEGENITSNILGI